MALLSEDLQIVYDRMDLSEDQKKDIHVLLILLKDMHDVSALSDVSYEDVKQILCCSDRKCECGSKFKPPLGNREAEATFTYKRLQELKRDLEKMKRNEAALEVLKKDVAEKHEIILDSGRTVNELRKHIRQLKVEIMHMYDELKYYL